MKADTSAMKGWLLMLEQPCAALMAAYKKVAGVAFSGLLIGLIACEAVSPPNKPMSHHAYVWQHQWTPALKQALSAAKSSVDVWHVLGAEVGKQGQIHPVNVDAQSLIQTQKPVIVVIRINGQLQGWEPDTLIKTGLALVDDWRKAGIPLIGLEIDHDCATKRLPEYAKFIDQLRPALSGKDLSLIITALPSWMGSPALTDLLGRVDEAVLQVHSVSDPKQGLFDPEQAARWVKQFSSLSPAGFRVALPTYGSKIAWDEDGRILAVESEGLMGLVGERTRELTVSPQAVTSLIDALRKTILPGFQGIVWFRLPTSDDQRAWSLDTWKAVMAGRKLTPKFAATSMAGQHDGVFDIFLSNESDVDGTPPAHIQVSSLQGCSAADGLGDFKVMRSQKDRVFHLINPSTLRAHHRTIVGWVRCPDREVQIHAYP